MTIPEETKWQSKKTAVGLMLAVLPGLMVGQTETKEQQEAIDITGRVVDASKLPLPRTIVTLRFRDPEEPQKQTLTDEEGRFAFRSVSPEPYELRFYEQGFKPTMVRLTKDSMDQDIDVGLVILEVGESTEGPMVTVRSPGKRARPKSQTSSTVALKEMTDSRRPCSTAFESGRRIVSNTGIVEFRAPRSASIAKSNDIDYVIYHIRYGAKAEKFWLTMMFGPLVGGQSPHNIQDNSIKWVSKTWALQWNRR